MGKTYPKRKGKGPKKPRAPKLACILALLALAGLSLAQAGEMPKAGDMALGGSLSLTNTLPDESCKNVAGPSHCGHGTTIEQCGTDYPMKAGLGLSFETWADEHWSYQAGVAFAEQGSPSAFSASAWHAPMGQGAGFFGSIGLAMASGTGLMADAGAGLEFFPGETAVQLRVDYFYDLDNAHTDDGDSYGVGIAIRKKW